MLKSGCVSRMIPICPKGLGKLTCCGSSMVVPVQVVSLHEIPEKGFVEKFSKLPSCVFVCRVGIPALVPKVHLRVGHVLFCPGTHYSFFFALWKCVSHKGAQAFTKKCKHAHATLSHSGEVTSFNAVGGVIEPAKEW